jgi:uncharacterized protein (DUF433 family)
MLNEQCTMTFRLSTCALSITEGCALRGVIELKTPQQIAIVRGTGWTEADVRRKRRCAMNNLLHRITIDPQVCHGKPVIRGLRYPVETMLELMSAGMSLDDILADYADLEREDLLAVLAFATRLSQVKRMEPVGV